MLQAQQRNRERIRLLDILRGFAILGTLGTNIWIFAHLGDLSYIFTVQHNEWWASIEDFIRMFVLFIVNGKFLGMLTILFGVGLEIKYQQAMRKNMLWPRYYVWTACILLLEGFLHFVLVMEYDILMSYGLTAIIVAFIVKRGDTAIKKAMYGFGSFHVLMILLIFLGTVIGQTSGANIQLIGDMTHVVPLYQEGTWFEQVQYRLEQFWVLRSEVIFVISMNVFLFLLGVRLMRAGAFADSENGRRIRAKLLRLGLMIGLPLNLLLFIPGGLFDFPVRYLFAPVLALGYIALIAMWVERTKSLWIWSGLERIGKMALSCYVFQNVVCSFLFYGWGLGLGGQLSAVMVVCMWVMVSILQLAFASLWLRKCKLGPMESARKFLAR